MTNKKQNGNATAAAEAATEFAIQRLYLKDCSFETPHTPDIFRAEWQPKVDLELNLAAQPLSDEVHEVVVAVTATAKVDDKVAFLVEVKQAGIFTIKGFPTEQLPVMLSVVCPGILFPYVREAVSDLVVRGSFPQLLLDPVNFEAMYLQNRQKQQEELANVNSSEAVDTH